MPSSRKRQDRGGGRGGSQRPFVLLNLESWLNRCSTTKAWGHTTCCSIKQLVSTSASVNQEDSWFGIATLPTQTSCCSMQHEKENHLRFSRRNSAETGEIALTSCLQPLFHGKMLGVRLPNSSSPVEGWGRSRTGIRGTPSRVNTVAKFWKPDRCGARPT